MPESHQPSSAESGQSRADGDIAYGAVHSLFTALTPRLSAARHGVLQLKAIRTGARARTTVSTIYCWLRAIADCIGSIDRQAVIPVYM